MLSKNLYKKFNHFIFETYLILKFKKEKYPSSPFLLLKKLQAGQYWNKTQLNMHQIDKLNDLIKNSVNKTRYYGKILKKAQYVKTLKDYNSVIPALLKKDIIINSRDLLSENSSASFKHTTSGSTGDPMSIEISGMAEAYRKATFMRFLDWWGLKTYDKSVLIWGLKKTNSQSNSLFQIVKNYFRNRLDINVFDLNDETIKKYFNQIERFKPKYIRGYKSGVLMLAQLMERHKLKLHRNALKVIIVTSEVLFDNEREYIEKNLNCKVANEYGSAECGLFAYECPHGSMHINEELVYLRTDNENRLYATELYNDKMPLLNYMNNDKVIISKELCECARTSRIIEKIEGRVNDFIICPDGKEKSQYIFYYIIKELDDVGLGNSIVKYKIYQEDLIFTILIIPNNNYCDRVEGYLRKRLIEEIGNKIIIKIKIVNDIPLEESGKLRFFQRVR